MRSAPRQGYGTEAKAAYREAVWDCLAEVIPSIGDGKILIMPSSEGLEIEVALDRGARPENLIAVDRSAAVIATSAWRKRHPSVPFFASEIKDAPAKLAQRGIFLRAANLDLCGKFSEETIRQVSSFANYVPRYNDFMFAVTVAKGRESSSTSILLNYLGGSRAFEDCRMATLFRVADAFDRNRDHVEVIGQGSYRSGSHPMTWAAVRVRDVNTVVADRFGTVLEAISHLVALLRQGATGQAERAADNLVDAELRCGMTSEGLPELPRNVVLRGDKAKWSSDSVGSEFLRRVEFLIEPGYLREFDCLRNAAWRRRTGLKVAA